jgi:preprotein translocase subunit SecG
MFFPLTLVLIVQVVSALTIIVLVLLQQGKGADMGSSFGTGSAGSLFGASGAANFLSRATKWAAVVFFISTGGLAWLGHHGSATPAAVDSGVMQGFQAPTDKSVPEAPGAPGAPAAGGSAVPGGAGVPAAPDVPAPSSSAPSSSSSTGLKLPSAGSSGASTMAPSTPSSKPASPAK